MGSSIVADRLRCWIGMDWRVRFTIDLMRRDLARPLPVAALSRLVNLSPSRFAHLFQRDTAHSPLRYLRQLRLDCAKTLAEESVLSIKEIMTRVGFNDPSHFTRDFKRRHGAPPRTIRARACADDLGRTRPVEQYDRPTNSRIGQRSRSSCASCGAYAGESTRKVA
jgi:AraC-like DNA-binding protein